MTTTTKNFRKLSHRSIIAKWQTENAMKCAVALLKRISNETADPKITEMYLGLLRDQKSIKNAALVSSENGKAYTVSDGYDVYLECLAYLIEMNKNGYWQLFAPETITLTMSKGKTKKVSLWQGMRYHARHYIYKYGQTDFKSCYIEDLSQTDNNGDKINCYDVLDGLIKAPQYYDIANERDLYTFTEFLNSLDLTALNLTARQKTILHYRLKGVSITDIANKLNVSQQAISKQLAKLQDIVKELYPNTVRAFKEKRKSAK